MTPPIRPFAAADLPRVVTLSLAAWAPVFAAVERQLAGSGVYETQHPDWRAGQRSAVEAACADAAAAVHVAEVDGEVAGFVAVAPGPEASIGEIHMVAVDPAYQRRGIGAALTEFAVRSIADSGCTTAMVETGGDAGHGPPRGLYERAGFTAFPVVRYFRTV